jgi:hypothetical protein
MSRFWVPDSHWLQDLDIDAKRASADLAERPLRNVRCSEQQKHTLLFTYLIAANL